MGLSERLALGATAVVAATIVAAIAVSPTDDTAPAISGFRGAQRPMISRETAGVIDAGHLQSGPIVAMTETAAGVFVLQNSSWLLVARGKTFGPFGSSTRGRPGWIASGVAIEVRDSQVYILDRTRRAVHVFTHDGTWRRTVDLAIASGLPDRFVMDRAGRWIVSAFINDGLQNSRWLLLRYDHHGAADTIYIREGSTFDFVIPVVADGNRVYAFNSATYRVDELSADGLGAHFVRGNPPRVPIPDSVRRSLNRYMSKVPGRSTAGLRYVPIVVHAASLPAGRFAVAISTSLDKVMVEEIDSMGRPHATLVESAQLPIALVRGGMLSLVEETNRTIVQRQRF